MSIAHQEKAALRKVLLARRAALPCREERTAAIVAQVLQSPVYRQAKQLFCYRSMGTEVGTIQLMEAALAQGKQVFAPCCPPGKEMVFLSVTESTRWEVSFFGVEEPVWEQEIPLIYPPQGLCITPGLAFTKEGYRLGYGKGYYDRFLQRTQMTAMGLCFGELLLDALPIEPHDRKVDWIVTPQTWD